MLTSNSKQFRVKKVSTRRKSSVRRSHLPANFFLCQKISAQKLRKSQIPAAKRLLPKKLHKRARTRTTRAQSSPTAKTRCQQSSRPGKSANRTVLLQKKPANGRRKSKCVSPILETAACSLRKKISKLSKWATDQLHSALAQTNTHSMSSAPQKHLATSPFKSTYSVIKVLGVGAYSTVLLCRHRRNLTLAAAKVIAQSTLKTPQDRANFRVTRFRA